MVSHSAQLNCRPHFGLRILVVTIYPALMAMSQASRDATMASFSFPLTKYTFSTVPTALKKWEYNHISSPPVLQLLLRPYELSDGYCLEIVSGTDKLVCII